MVNEHNRQGQQGPTSKSKECNSWTFSATSLLILIICRGSFLIPFICFVQMSSSDAVLPLAPSPSLQAAAEKSKLEKEKEKKKDEKKRERESEKPLKPLTSEKSLLHATKQLIWTCKEEGGGSDRRGATPSSTAKSAELPVAHPRTKSGSVFWCRHPKIPRDLPEPTTLVVQMTKTKLKHILSVSSSHSHHVDLRSIEVEPQDSSKSTDQEKRPSDQIVAAQPHTYNSDDTGSFGSTPLNRFHLTAELT
ncbi:hypothetical protein UY3_17318 [Chelonia mydas]|uniref:Uncharacterized protein n=1 Tax=Chelonia mydas TaxID=8469 RepID=M7B0M6_CHEMY|nr:hypothetical protein UY3_17318 [Chelonia mydas]